MMTGLSGLLVCGAADATILPGGGGEALLHEQEKLIVSAISVPCLFYGQCWFRNLSSLFILWAVLVGVHY